MLGSLFTDLAYVAGNRNLIQDTDVGEIVVYNVKDKDIPIVHRVVRKFGTGYVLPVDIRARHVNATYLGFATMWSLMR